MKKPILSLLIATSALLVPQVSSAALLAGYANFTAAGASNTGDVASYVASGDLTATYSGGGNLLLQNGGPYEYSSNSGNYGGNASYPVSTPDDHTSLGTNGPNLTFTLSSNGAVQYTLNSFLVEIATGGGNSSLTVNYQTFLGATPTSALTNLTPAGLVSHPVTPGPTGQTWDGYTVGLGSIVGSLGGTFDKIVFTLSSSGGGVDNLGITSLSAIPETSGFAVLGCLVGSGAFFRSRRRSVSVIH